MEVKTIDLQAEVEKSRGRAPQPPAEEQQRRLERTREILASHELDAVLLFGSSGTNPEPVRYLAGYVHVFPTASSFLLIPLDAPPILLIDQAWHVDEAARMTWIRDVRSFPNGGRRWLSDELKEVLGSAIADARVGRGRIGILDVATPTVYFQSLQSAGPDVTFVDGKPVWEELVATPGEYDEMMIRQTAQIADEGLAAAVGAAEDGAAEHEVCLESLRRMASLGAEFLHGSGVSTHINIGSHSDVVSNVRPFLFTANRLEEGQTFWLDLTASYGGYYIDCDRTIAIGNPSDEHSKLYEVTREMYEAMLGAARAGISGGDLWDIGNDVAVRAGYDEYSNHVYLGHTTGITTSERPVIARGESMKIRAGSFINVEPGIFVPGLGSACIENTLAIGDDGAAAVNAFGIDIHVV